MDNPLGTCQICERKIKVVNGKIARHGYYRPDMGYQTTSCFGTGYLPLEISSGAIFALIVLDNGSLGQTKAHKAQFLAAPPDNLWLSKKMWPRPENFDPKAIPVNPSGYCKAYLKTLSMDDEKIFLFQAHIARLTERLNNWFPTSTPERI